MNKNEKKMIEQIRKDFVARCLKGSDGCDLRDCQHCHAESLYNAGYRKVGKDEIVVKKSKIGMLEKTIGYLEMEKAQLNKQLEQAEQEMAREILQIVDSRLDIYRIGIFGREIDYDKGYKMAIQDIKMLIKTKYGIEGEKNL